MNLYNFTDMGNYKGKFAFIFAVLLSGFCMSSCGPTAYLLDIETSHPSEAGVDLAGKTISAVYLDNGDVGDSLFSAALATSFVTRMEKDYFQGDSLISIYCLDKAPETDYSSKREMLEILMDTGSDVVFVFDAPEFQDNVAVNLESDPDGSFMAKASFPFSIELYVYDSMDKRDTVLRFRGASVADASSAVSGKESRDALGDILKSQLGGTARRLGDASGDKFSPVWKMEEVLFFLYDSNSWYETYFYVRDYEWQKAIDIWMSMLDTANMEKKACIEYNIAAACYLSGQYDLASDWLELSRRHFNLSPYTDSLGKKLAGRSK